MQFRTLENVGKAELIQVFNSAFADYFVKIEMTEQSLDEKILSENIVLERSVGSFFDDKLVGFVLIGIDGKNSYNGGTGVLPDFRGQNLTVKMYDFFFAKGFTSQQLEVITENVAAIKTYEKIGFSKSRTLGCFKGKINVSNINQDVKLKVLDEIDEANFHKFWNSQPSWQNSLSAINRTKNLHKIVGAFYENSFVGYIIFTQSGRIKQFAVKQDFRRMGIGQTLFNQVNNQEVLITNIDKNDRESVEFLRKLGLNLFLEQFEMTLTV
jgi:ribosomal protein S18 acetylase RimI-like enzyme